MNKERETLQKILDMIADNYSAESFKNFYQETKIIATEALKEPTERYYSREDVLDLLCDYADLIHSTKSRTPLQHEWLANWGKIQSLSPKEGWS